MIPYFEIPLKLRIPMKEATNTCSSSLPIAIDNYPYYHHGDSIALPGDHPRHPASIPFNYDYRLHPH